MLLLYPVLALKIEDRADRNDQHQRKRQRVAVIPGELRHVAKFMP